MFDIKRGEAKDEQLRSPKLAHHLPIFNHNEISLIFCVLCHVQWKDERVIKSTIKMV